jgi:hypothetical protein
LKARLDPTFIVSLLVPALLGLYLLLTSTAQLVPGIALYDAKRILQLGLLLVLFLLSLTNAGIRQEFSRQLAKTPPWIKLTLTAIFLWGLCSSLFHTQSLMHAVSSLAEVCLLFLLVLALFVVAACRSLAGHIFDQLALGLVALTGLAVGVQELIGAAAVSAAGFDYSYEIALVHYSFPRFYNQVQSWAVPVLAGLPLIFYRNRLVYILCLLVLGLHWYIILMTGARGSFVSIASACIFAALILPSPVRSRLLTWQLAGLVLGAVIYSAVLINSETNRADEFASSGIQHSQPVTPAQTRPVQEGTRPFKSKSRFLDKSLGRPMIHTSGRMRMWSRTSRDALANPILGIGPLNYVCTSDAWFGHPHNFPLQIAAEWGILVAIAICAVFMVLGFSIAQKVRHEKYGSSEENIFAGLIFTGVIAAALHACLSGIMVMPASQVTGLLLCGMLLGMTPARQMESSNPVTLHRVIPGFLLSLGVLISASLMIFGVNELRTMESRIAALDFYYTLRPRFWQNGVVCNSYTPQNKVTN